MWLVLALVLISFQLDAPTVAAGVVWTIEIADNELGTGGFPSIAIDPNGWPRISNWYGYDKALRYAWRDTSGWHNTTVDRRVGPGGLGWGSSLAIDSTGIPHISYFVRNGTVVPQDVWYCYYDRPLSSWKCEFVASAGYLDELDQTSIALNSTEDVSIAYVNVETGALMFASRTTGGWVVGQVDVPGFASGQTLSTSSLKFDSLDRAHIAYLDPYAHDLRYAVSNGTAWDLETVDTEAGYSAPSLDLDSRDRPWIAYSNVPFNSELKYATWTGSSWNISVVPGTIDVESPSISLDSADFPHISYILYTPQHLMYTYWDGTLWRLQTVDTDYAAFWSSLAMDASGNAHIAYYHYSSEPRLQYARGAPVNDLPASNLSSIAPYWWTSSPLSITTTASDPDGTVSMVNLWYRFDDGSGWGPWSSFGSDGSPPWEWSFTFPDGEGRYEFYSLAFDGTDWEVKAPSADASAGYDVTPPTSSANPLSPYLWTSPSLVVDATANDTLSGVSTVSLYYQFSPDNTTWGPCSPYMTDTAPSWSWPFPFPEGGGFYRFHTIATDVAGNIEGGKTCQEAMVSYHPLLTPGHRFISFPLSVSDDAIESVLSSISGCYDSVRWYDPLDSVDPWKSYTPGRGYNDLTRLDNTMGFWINVTAACSLTLNGTRPVSTTIELHQGWNMAGFPSFNTTYTVADMRADIGVAGIVVETYDASAGPYYLQRVSDDYVMMAGEGYWVYVPSDVIWNVYS